MSNAAKSCASISPEPIEKWAGLKSKAAGELDNCGSAARGFLEDVFARAEAWQETWSGLRPRKAGGVLGGGGASRRRDEEPIPLLPHRHELSFVCQGITPSCPSENVAVSACWRSLFRLIAGKNRGKAELPRAPGGPQSLTPQGGDCRLTGE